jgi:hypothetical protein
VLHSVRSWTRGNSENWRTIERYNTVDAPAAAPPQPETVDKTGNRRPAGQGGAGDGDEAPDVAALTSTTALRR